MEPTGSKPYVWLCVWTLNNISVTLLNKICFSTVDFQYPYFLSFVHMLCNSMGTRYVFWRIKRDDKLGTVSKVQNLLGYLVRKDLDKIGMKHIRLFSLIFSLNIALGNVSLNHVSVNFNQVMRSLVPVVTIFMGMVVGKKFTWQRVMSVFPIVTGVAMACYGDMTYTSIGFFYTVACVIIAAIKVVAAGEMLTGPLKLHPVDLLCHLAPIAMIQCLSISIATGEVFAILKRPELYFTDARPMAMVLLSGICSFSLNITSLMTNKLTSPLTLTIAGNVKQVMMIVISTIIFSTPILPLNGIGIVIVLIGSTIYSCVSLKENNEKAEAADQRCNNSTPDSVTSLILPLNVENCSVEEMPTSSSSRLRTGACRNFSPPSPGKAS